MLPIFGPPVLDLEEDAGHRGVRQGRTPRIRRTRGCAALAHTQTRQEALVPRTVCSTTFGSTPCPGRPPLWNLLIQDLGIQILSGLLLAALGKVLRKAVTAWRQRTKAEEEAQIPSNENP